MAKVVIHIGTHKTASTTIQDMFAHNAELLKQHGVIYPRLGRSAGHHGLVMSWNKLPEVYAISGGGPAALRQISDDYGSGDHTVFLSSEEFSRGAEGRQVDFTEVRGLLSGFAEIEVICVLRPQWQFLQSIYLEMSKNQTPPPPPSFVTDAISTGMVQGLWADYNVLYDHLLKAFAPEEITLLDFDTCRTGEGGIIGAILMHLGIALSPDDLEAVNGGVSNASPLSLPTWAANLIATPQPAPAWLIECTSNAFRVEFGEVAKPCLFSKAEYSRLAAHFAQANARLAARRKPVQPDFAISQAESDAACVFREAVTISYWLRCNRWIFAHKVGER